MKQLFFLLLFTVTYLIGTAQTGTLDETFGNNGLLTVGNSGYQQTTALLVLKDNKMLVLNTNVEDGRVHRLTRLLPDGQIDNSFGKDGSQEIPKIISEFNSLLVQQDNKIVLVTGSLGKSVGVITFFRYLPNGITDSSFGINGIYVDSSQKQTAAFDATLQPDGKILVSGQYVNNASEGDIYPLIARYNQDGTPDNSFGVNGKTILSELNFLPISIALQNDGKIVCGGDEGGQNKFIVARFNANGNLDESFGTNGVVETNFTRYRDYCRDIAIQNDNKILAFGTAQDQSFNSLQPEMAVARYNPDGSLDGTFDQDGKIMIPFNSYTLGKSAVLQQDGKIVVSGSTRGTSREDDFDYCVGRLNTDGSLDIRFGTEGKTITDINEGSYDDVFQVGLQSTGNIIVSGVSGSNNLYSGVLARYTGGKPETAFPIAKIKTWLQQRAIKWQPIYSSGHIDFYAIEKSKSYSGAFTEIKRYEAEALPQPLVTRETVTYSYNPATEATAGATSVSYYRIKAVYNNGSSIYSDVVSDSLLINNNPITIAPNPVKDVMKISGLPVNQKSTINIINRNGNVLQSAICNNTICNLNVAQLKSGFYTVQVISSGKTQTLKFVKE